jgi:hypothetical protein
MARDLDKESWNRGRPGARKAGQRLADLAQAQTRNTMRPLAFTCADCGEPVPRGQKGQTCPHCNMWPLCDGCAEQHDQRGPHALPG